jgi:hypothetical protein
MSALQTPAVPRETLLQQLREAVASMPLFAR